MNFVKVYHQGKKKKMIKTHDTFTVKRSDTGSVLQTTCSVFSGSAELKNVVPSTTLASCSVCQTAPPVRQQLPRTGVCVLIHSTAGGAKPRVGVRRGGDERRREGGARVVCRLSQVAKQCLPEGRSVASLTMTYDVHQCYVDHEVTACQPYATFKGTHSPQVRVRYSCVPNLVRQL